MELEPAVECGYAERRRREPMNRAPQRDHVSNAGKQASLQCWQPPCLFSAWLARVSPSFRLSHRRRRQQPFLSIGKCLGSWVFSLGNPRTQTLPRSPLLPLMTSPMFPSRRPCQIPRDMTGFCLLPSPSLTVVGIPYALGMRLPRRPKQTALVYIRL